MKGEGKKGRETNYDSNLFRDKFDFALGIVSARYGIDFIYIGDVDYSRDTRKTNYSHIGLCSIYLLVDCRKDNERNNQDFDRLVFERIDGRTTKGAQFNSVILPKKEAEFFARVAGVKINLDSECLEKKIMKDKRVVYEAIAVNELNFCDFL